MSEKFIENRNLYHTFSRIAIQEGQGVAAAVNKTGHTVTTNDIWTDVDKLPKNTTYFGNANAGFDDLKTVYDSDPTTYAKYVTLQDGVLSPVDGSGQDANKNQAWQLLVDGKRVTNFVAPTDVFDNDGKPCNGYTVQLFDKNGTQIAATDGNWAFDYLAGLVIFERGKTPQDMGWAGTTESTYIKIKAWSYAGSFLNTKLENLDQTIASSDNFGSHSIEILKQATTDGYASSYRLFVDNEAKGDIINIPKDQFLKGTEIVEGIYADGAFTASKDITDEQLKKDIKKYIHFTFEIKVKDADLAETTQEKHIYLDIQDLCDVYTGGYGITVTADNVINVDLGKDTETTKYLGFDSTSALIIDGLDVDNDGNYIKAEYKVSGNLEALDTAVGELSGKFNNITHHTLTAFGKDYDTTANVTISGGVVTGEKYIDYDQAEGIFTLSSTNLDVAVDGNYVLSGNTVATNLTALDTAVGELSGGTYISGDVVASDLKRLDAAIDAAIEAAEHTHVAGNAGIAVSETDGQVSISAVVAPNDLHLGIGAAGIETSGLVTASGYVISANTTVAENLEALDTQIKTNADAIANLIKDCNINITSGNITIADTTLTGLLDTEKSKVVSGVVTIVFNKEILEIGQREAAKGVTLSGKFEDVYPDEEFDTETKVTTLSADFGNYLDDEKTVQWRITYRG